MSYARGGESDIYLYHSMYGEWHCHCNNHSVFLSTIGKVQEHVDYHIADGDDIPDHTVERIRKEVEKHGKDWKNEDWAKH